MFENRLMIAYFSIWGQFGDKTFFSFKMNFK